jgi:hypothetical protein
VPESSLPSPFSVQLTEVISRAAEALLLRIYGKPTEMDVNHLPVLHTAPRLPRLKPTSGPLDRRLGHDETDGAGSPSSPTGA